MNVFNLKEFTTYILTGEKSGIFFKVYISSNVLHHGELLDVLEQLDTTGDKKSNNDVIKSIKDIGELKVVVPRSDTVVIYRNKELDN